MGSNPFAPKKKYSTKPKQPWELKHTPEFYWDGEDHAWFRCPHMREFVMLSTAKWTLMSTDPLTVSPSIHNQECGCHGWIKDDKWIDTSNLKIPLNKGETL